MVPVVLISASGLLLLSITNRLGRTVDRSRSLASESESSSSAQKNVLKSQLTILLRRSELLRTSVTFVAANILFASVMIVGLFFLTFMDWHIQGPIMFCFFMSVICLIAATVFFLFDISLALKAVRLDVEPHL